jgi:hypothetical protein
LRGLNRAFKTQIEQFYVDYYLKRTTVHMSCGTASGDIELKLLLDGHFTFDGFEDGEGEGAGNGNGRVVVMREKYIIENFWGPAKPGGHSVRWLMLGWHGMTNATQLQSHFSTPYESFEKTDYHPKMLVQVRRELTDLLPMDLEGHFAAADYAFRFDWRTYLCTFFNEMRSMDVVHEPTGECDVDLKSQGLAAGSKRHDEDVLAARRKRRVRIGMKSGGCGGSMGEMGEEERGRYARQDEAVVLSHTRDYYEYVVDYETFSDSESEGEEDGRGGEMGVDQGGRW